MNVVIIGCGLIGQKRAKAIKGCHLLACVDLIAERAQSLANQFSGCKVLTDWREALKLPDIDIVIIATTHAQLAEIAYAAIKAGKHVLLEKPGARNARELEPLLATAQYTQNVCVRVGFNHRYHRALRKAKELINEGVLGQLMFLRGRYGHGGRLGYHH